MSDSEDTNTSNASFSSEEYASVQKLAEHFNKTYRQFQQLVYERMIDKMPTLLAVLRVFHGRMQLSHFELQNRIYNGKSSATDREFHDLSKISSYIASSLRTIEDCENIKYSLLADITSRDVPFIQDEEEKVASSISKKEHHAHSSTSEAKEEVMGYIDADTKKLSKKPWTDSHREQPTLLLYHWDKCNACIDFKPIWNEFKKEYFHNPGAYGPIKIKELESTANKELFKQAGINGVPSIRLFYKNKDGKREIIEYSGRRTVDALIQFIKEKLE
jgi:thiol-disulfide isomerase/thioredoxin